MIRLLSIRFAGAVASLMLISGVAACDKAEQGPQGSDNANVRIGIDRSVEDVQAAEAAALEAAVKAADIP